VVELVIRGDGLSRTVKAACVFVDIMAGAALVIGLVIGMGGALDVV